jgi:isopentenyldiphosphate isomerase
MTTLESRSEAADERLEVCTPHGQGTGVIKPRHAIHADGDWHIASYVWVFDGKGRILLQRRAPHKDAWPGRWDASAAGHVEAGETAIEAARRELAEELGLEVNERDLVRVAGQREEHVHPNGRIDREHHAVFLLRADLPLEAYRPGPEVTAIALADALVSLMQSAHVLQIEALETDAAESRARTHPITLRSDELVPHSSEYIAAVAELAKNGGRAPPSTFGPA